MKSPRTGLNPNAGGGGGGVGLACAAVGQIRLKTAAERNIARELALR